MEGIGQSKDGIRIEYISSCGNTGLRIALRHIIGWFRGGGVKIANQ